MKSTLEILTQARTIWVHGSRVDFVSAIAAVTPSNPLGCLAAVRALKAAADTDDLREFYRGINDQERQNVWRKAIDTGRVAMILSKRLTHPNATVRYEARLAQAVRRELAGDSIETQLTKAERKREDQRERAMR